MKHQPRPKLGLRHFLQDLNKAHPLFWIVLLLSVAFILFQWLVP